MKVQVKFLESVAVMADPRPKVELDQKYANYKHLQLTRPKPRSAQSIEASIAEMKLADRYGETPLGFATARCFKPGAEAFIDEQLALNWRACGYLEMLRESGLGSREERVLGGDKNKCQYKI